MSKLWYKSKYMNNYKYLIIFVQIIESLTANSIFHQLVWWRHQLVSKDIFIIEEQLRKIIWQLVEG